MYFEKNVINYSDLIAHGIIIPNKTEREKIIVSMNNELAFRIGKATISSNNLMLFYLEHSADNPIDYESDAFKELYQLILNKKNEILSELVDQKNKSSTLKKCHIEIE